MAGKRKGKEDERHLWPEMLRAIQEIKPRWIVGENVRGLISWNGGLVFEEVQADLETAGYEVQPFLLPACGVNAPHRRDRIWFVAYSNNKGGGSRLGQVQEKDGEISKWNNDAEFGNSSDGITADSDGIRWDNGSNNWEERQISHDEERNTEKSESKWSGRISGVGQICCDGFTSNTKNLDALRLGENNSNRESLNKSQWEEVRSKFGDISSKGDVTNTSNKRLEGCEVSRSIGGSEKKSYKQSSRCVCAGWENFPTVPPICNGDDGLSTQLDGITFPKWRNESIKAGGNAIVPQVALQIFKAIQAYEDGNS